MIHVSFPKTQKYSMVIMSHTTYVLHYFTPLLTWMENNHVLWMESHSIKIKVHLTQLKINIFNFSYIKILDGMVVLEPDPKIVKQSRSY